MRTAEPSDSSPSQRAERQSPRPASSGNARLCLAGSNADKAASTPVPLPAAVRCCWATALASNRRPEARTRRVLSGSGAPLPMQTLGSATKWNTLRLVPSESLAPCWSARIGCWECASDGVFLNDPRLRSRTVSAAFRAAPASVVEGVHQNWAGDPWVTGEHGSPGSQRPNRNARSIRFLVEVRCGRE